MNRETLTKMFGLNHSCIKVNTEGLTHEDSLLQPQPGGNCLNWVLGHIVFTRNLILDLLGESPIWSEDEGQPYKRGLQPILNSKSAHSFEKMLADFNRSQEQILDALTNKTEEDFARKVDEETVGEKLTGLHFHEAYHVGQSGLLRRLVGKEGAIK